MNGVKLLLGGDVMLGRLVAREIVKRGPGWPLGALAPVLRRADLRVVNLECALTDSKIPWQGAPKAFYFGAPKAASAVLAQAKIDVASLANNHILDFETEGLIDTLRILDEIGVKRAGAGEDFQGAAAPAYFEKNGITFSMLAYCDHQHDFMAAEGSPGINFLDLEEPKPALSRLEQDFVRLKKTDWPILSLHYGPNMVERPTSHQRAFIHAAMDIGFGIFFGHSAHVFQGIEIYRGRPIFYACGDFVDDYYVDPYFRNDRQLLFELALTKSQVDEIILHPITIESCRAVPAAGEDLAAIETRMTALCAEFGTEVSDSLKIRPAR